MLINTQIARFTRFGVITLVAIYVLILIGGLVRATGSGMGCPDWPKCFGKLVPPTEESQLPLHYKDEYVAKRKVKNERIASFMQKLGFSEIHDAIVADDSVYQAEEFNATKTWIEYINRLVGALIGFFILLTCCFAWPLRKLRKGVFGLSILTLFLTFVQAFLGSIVVSTNLIPASVTFHMLFTLVMVWALMQAIINSQGVSGGFFPSLRRVALVNLLIAITQVLLGTQVRETVDTIKSNQDHVSDWLEALTMQSHALEIHRVMAFLVTISTLYLVWQVYAVQASKMLTFVALLAAGSVLIAMISGIVLAYFNLPAFVQPIHLTIGTLLVGCHTWIFLACSVKSANKAYVQVV